MEITLTSTSNIITLNNVPVRIWEGTTKSGIKIHALITRIACSYDEERKEELENELNKAHAPCEEYIYPLRMIL